MNPFTLWTAWGRHSSTAETENPSQRIEVMLQPRDYTGPDLGGLPRVCGDVPYGYGFPMRRVASAPRMRGCSRVLRSPADDHFACPAYAGMSPQ